MNDENRTRIIRTRPTEDKSKPASETRVVGDVAEPADQAEDSPRTRTISGRSSSGSADDGAASVSYELAVGWLVITEGPGRGCTREIYYGMNGVGRGGDERIPLDFGDTAISREAHAYVVYDEKQNEFYVQHGGKSNLVRLNDAPVLSPQPLSRGDIIELGGTKLMFVPLCDDKFNWVDSAP